jgi:hypothetical protein
MPRIPFALQTAADASPPLTRERLVNLMVEKAPEQARSPFVVRSTPGLKPFVSILEGPIYAATYLGGQAFILSGDQFVRLNEDATFDVLGTITDGELVGATIAASLRQVVICCPPNAYIWDGSVFGPITDPDFPGARSVDYLAGYFVYAGMDNQGRFFWSALFDGYVYDALDFATAESSPDALLTAMAVNGDLWLFGGRTVEIWSAAESPAFVRQAGGVIPRGCIADRSPSLVDRGACWLGHDLMVYYASGTEPKRISTHAVEQAISGYTNPRSAIGFTVTYDGHECYCLTFDQDGATWVYDFATQVWHERSSAPAAGRWRVQCGIRFGNRQIVGDAFTGDFWELDKATATEAGATVQRQLITPPLFADTRRAFMSKLELEMEMGAGPGSFTMEYSDDGGHTFGHARAGSMGASGAYRQRCIWRRLGSFRDRAFRFTWPTGPRLSLFALDADVQQGDA